MGKIALFNGGISTVLAPHLIAENEGGFYINVNHRPGTLKPMKDKLGEVLGAERFGHYFTKESKWYWSSTAKDYVEFQERLYIGNRHGVSTKVVSGEETNLGIVGPAVNPSIAGTSYELTDLADVTLFALGTIFGSSVGDIPDGLDLEYRLVTENTAGVLSAAGTIFEVKTGTLGPNAVYITIADEGWDNDVHVYRRHLGDWRLITTVTYDPNVDTQPAIQDVVYDISANTILDEGILTAVGVLTGRLSYAYTFYNSTFGTESVPKLITPSVTVVNGIVELTGLEVSTDPQVDSKRIYRIGGDITDYHLVNTTSNATTSYTDTTADLDLSGELLVSSTNYPPPATGMNWLIEAYAMLFASRGDKLIFTPIGQPDSWPLTYFLDFPAFITGIGKTPVGLLVFTEFETFLVTGTGPLSLSQQLLSGSQGCIAGGSVVNVQGAVYWASSDGICISEGGKVVVYTRPKVRKMNLSKTVNAVVYDQEYYILAEDRGITYILDVERKVLRSALYDIRSFITANDKLYGFSNSALHNIEAAFKDLDMTYASPEFIGAGLTIQKVYKNIYVQSSGNLTISISIDGKEVQKVELTTNGNHQIKIPAEESRGFKISFVVRGTGIVYEITWGDGNANQ